MPARTSAQVVSRDTTRPPGDTTGNAVPLPSDTAHKVPKDTLKAPLAVAELPPLLGVGEQYRWDRASMFATGSITLLDLLERMPGVTTYRSGWLGSPQYVAYLGNPARVRVFYDGTEIEPLSTRSPGALDMAEVQLWTLQDVVVERGADELRVYTRSWSVTRTTPQTRTDVTTGDLGTNLYRGFFGKRFGNGMALQLGAQQYGTSSAQDIGGGSDLALLARAGWAKGNWSVDAFGLRSSRTRDAQLAVLAVDGLAGQIPELDRKRTDAYLRAGYGTPDSGAWAQLIASSQKWDEHSPHGQTTTPLAPPDSADTVRTATQFIATGGLTKWGLRLSAADRFHMLHEGKLNALSARLSYEHPRFALSLYAEHRGGDSSGVEEVSARLSPLSFVALSGTISRRHGGEVTGDEIGARAEAGVRIHHAWIGGGVLRRDATIVPGLVAYDTAYRDAPSMAATGIYGFARGKVFQDIGVDVWGVRWDAGGYYRPRIQTREEIYLDTKWLRRFPSGHFGLLASAAHEYRQDVVFPTATSTEVPGPPNVFDLFSHALRFKIEVRVLDAVLFWNSFYGMSPTTLEYVPGFLMPRQRLLYGVRWEFWN